MRTKLIVLFLFFVILARPVYAQTSTGVKVTRMSNYLLPANTPMSFDAVQFGDESMWQGSRITIPSDGVWLVGAELTTLGSLYGGPNNSRVIIEIVKNWCGVETTCPHLYADICAARWEPQLSSVANINQVSCPVQLQAGDYIELLVSGKPGNLLIESNPNGAGVLSPNFYAIPLP